jgi:NAD-dependent SIR2 family protein deacetylase
VIFNTFTEDDDAYYQEALKRFSDNTQAQIDQNPQLPRVLCPSLETAREWLTSADCIIVSAGAGFSAATGLDYTSKSLFSQHFPAFTKRGLSTLYSVFGYQGWRSEEDRWGYYFTHLNMVKNWPRSDLYDTLLSWLHSRGVDTHTRTTNADGLFLAHGWPAEKLSTPQGSYAVFQCLDDCRPEAVVPSAPYIEAAASCLDPTTQQLTDPSKVPRCRFCGGKMSICVRAGSWFNDTPFKNGELAWKAFRQSNLKSAKRAVILELGVGENTPGVLKWPNEDLVARSEGRVTLVRLGLGPSAIVPSDLEASGSAIAVNGDLKVSIKELLR